MSGRGGITAGVTAAGRATPPTQPSPPPAPLIAPTGSPGLNSVIDVVNATAAPFMSAPPPEQGAAGVVAAGLGGVMGVIGAPQQIIDTAFATLTAPLAAMCPSLPAVTLLGMHVGVPHAHTHPPSLIPPAPPVPLPSIGMLLGAGAVTVLIGGMPAARAGDIGISVTCGSLAPPFEVFTGSSNVFIGGARAARTLDITKHCNPTAMGPFAIAMGAAGVAAGAAGAIAGNNIFAAAQAAADAAVLALKLLCGKDPGIPPGMGTLVGPPVPNVLIGGFPCPPVGDMAVGAILKGLSKAAKALKGKFSKKGNGHCANGSDPIYLVTGENFDEFVDFVSDGLFEWRRHYTTARARSDGPLGHGWRHFYQRNLSVRLHRASFTDWDGTELEFPRFPRGQTRTRAEGHVLERVARGHYRISHRNDPVLEFMGNEFAAELPLVRMFTKARELQFAYDALGRLALIVDSSRDGGEQRRYELRYDDSGHLAQLVETTHAAEPVLRAAYAYGKSADLSQAVDAMGGAWFYECDAFHRWSRKTDARGYSYTFKYDALGRCTEATGQDGLWWAKIEYFPEKNFTRTTEGENATWEYHYDGDGFITKIVDPYGGETVRERDAEGKLVRETDAGGVQTEWLYDADGAHYARVDQQGNLFPPELEAPNPPDPDERDLPSSALAFQFGELVPASQLATAGLDPSVLASVPARFQNQARICFRLRSPADVAQYWTRVERDALGRATREADSLGRARTWQYDATGNVIRRTDRDGRSRSLETTSWNLLGRSVDALGNGMEYRYSRLEELVETKDPLGNATRYDYDLKGRLVRVHRHDRVHEEYVYDLGDHLIEKRDGDGAVLFKNEIHENHRVAVRQLTSGGEQRFDYDRHGRVTEASTPDHEVRLIYRDTGPAYADLRDGIGIEHTREPKAWSTVLFERFRLQRRSVGGRTVLRDPAGQRSVVTHDVDGTVRRMCSNGSIEILKYDAEGRLEGQLVYRNSYRSRACCRSLAYTYSAEGDLLQVDDSERGTTRYQVDAAHRLTGEITPTQQNLVYSHDPAGNLLSKSGTTRLLVSAGNRAAASQDEVFEIDSRDRLALRTRSDGSGCRYSYDNLDHLVRVERIEPDGKSEVLWEASYDALARRIWSKSAGRKREFYWDGDRLAAELLPDGQLRIYQYASRTSWVPLGFADYASPTADPRSGRSYHVFSNPVGMPLWIEDGEGVVVWKADRVDPYGTIEHATAPSIEYNLRWPGHYYDPETGLHDNRHRSYDPKLGRYLQSDPIGYEGSPVNLFSYCPNPLVQVDLLGLEHSGRKPRSRSKGDRGKEGKPTRTERAADANEVSPVTGKKVKGAATVVEHSVDGEVVARYYVDGKGRTIRAEGKLDPPESYTKKGVGHIDPEGRQAGVDHRGHLIPERGAPNQGAVNVSENVVAEHGTKSNLSEKKSWENRAVDHAQDNPGCWSIHEPQYSGDDPRPTSIKHNLYDADGGKVPGFQQQIDNPRS